MFKNNIKIGFRNFLKSPLHSLINLLGLTIGMACCILIISYVLDELSFDRHFEHVDRIYRPVSKITFGGRNIDLASCPAPMAQAALNDLPEVIDAGRFRRQGSFMVRTEDNLQNVREQGAVYADNNILDIFSFEITKGELESPIVEPQTLAISESAAERHFGTQDPIGHTLILDNNSNYEVTAVYRDLPDNTHFNFDFLLSMEGLDESKELSWLSNNFQTYLLLSDFSDADGLEGKFDTFFRKYAGPQVQQILNVSLEDMEAQGQGIWYRLQPVTDIHLKSDLLDELSANGDMIYVYLFSAIALFILLIACINFMNLSTAKSSNRAKEVGVRKVLGSDKRQLITQFLTESTMMSLVAFGLAILLSELVLPYFNNLTNKTLMLQIANPVFVGSVLAAALIVGLLAGLYPAFYLSAFKPISVLKGQLKAGFKAGALRSFLVVFQFAISIILIVGTIVIYRQLNFIQNKKLGFEKEHTMLVSNVWALDNQSATFKNELSRLPNVKSVALSSFLPVPSSRSNDAWWPRGKLNDEDIVSMQNWTVDDDYVKTMGMKIIEGRDFDLDSHPSDSASVIINEAAAKIFDLENPEGEFLSKFTDPTGNVTRDFQIIGVVENFHFESLRESIYPCAFIIGTSNGNAAIKFATEDVQGLIEDVEGIWSQIGPGQPFEYSFMDDRFERIYRTERRTGTLFLVFAALAIFIACLGLFALASFSAEKRTKEIGIRKVLGASARNIFGLLTGEFFKWILIAYLISIPIAFFGAQRWLQNYVYQPGLDFWIFFMAAVVILVIAIVTVSYQVFKATRMNPIKALRYE